MFIVYEGIHIGLCLFKLHAIVLFYTKTGECRNPLEIRPPESEADYYCLLRLVLIFQKIANSAEKLVARAPAASVDCMFASKTLP